MPVCVEVDADTETPVSAFLKLSRGESHAFLFESVEGGERTGRWSFLGAGPRALHTWRLGEPGDPLSHVEGVLARHRAVRLEGFPRFTGGLVGHLSYDIVRLLEPRVPVAGPEEVGFPDALLMDFDTLVAFDNLRHTVQVIAQARCSEGDDPRALYRDAHARIGKVLARLRAPLEDARPAPLPHTPELRSTVTREAFEAAVLKAKEYIQAGDCQQIVLSQRFEAEVGLPPFELYRALRRVNPSPYLFFLKEGPQALVGSSPETLVKLEGDEVSLRPIAGTRRRGKSAAEDAALEKELLADPKENAEHAMLVDLGRNDVGRVSRMGTVRVTALKTVERYSHVLHMVSEVRGRLLEGKGCVDVLRATFPAGTLSGSPKVRAMELIDQLEPARRGPYGGCAGYFDLSGDMEMAITIRTLLQSGRRLSVQAGAGVVYDSVPADEYQETVNKAGALFAAVALAGARALRPGGPASSQGPAPRKAAQAGARKSAKAKAGKQPAGKQPAGEQTSGKRGAGKGAPARKQPKPGARKPAGPRGVARTPAAVPPPSTRNSRKGKDRP